MGTMAVVEEAQRDVLMGNGMCLEGAAWELQGRVDLEATVQGLCNKDLLVLMPVGSGVRTSHDPLVNSRRCGNDWFPQGYTCLILSKGWQTVSILMEQEND